MTRPDDHQVGGDHYRKVPGEQHWDRVYRLSGPGYFIGCATKYIERYRDKNGKEDLEKAIHFIQKLISLEYPEETPSPGAFDQYENSSATYISNAEFLCDGGFGDGTNLYTHRATRQLVRARGLQEAAGVWAARPVATPPG